MSQPSINPCDIPFARVLIIDIRPHDGSEDKTLGLGEEAVAFFTAIIGGVLEVSGCRLVSRPVEPWWSVRFPHSRGNVFAIGPGRRMIREAAVKAWEGYQQGLAVALAEDYIPKAMYAKFRASGTTSARTMLPPRPSSFEASSDAALATGQTPNSNHEQG